jgi:hypothetical protein
MSPALKPGRSLRTYPRTRCALSMGPIRLRFGERSGGFTLAQLASAVGLPDGDLATIESGGVVDKIAGALDVRQGILALVKVSS